MSVKMPSLTPEEQEEARKRRDKLTKNRPIADYAKWKKKDLWTLEQAIFLIFGIEPIGRTEKLGVWNFGGGFSEFFNEFVEDVNLSIAAKKLTIHSPNTRGRRNPYFLATDILNWASSKGYEVPGELKLPITTEQDTSVGDQGRGLGENNQSKDDQDELKEMKIPQKQDEWFLAIRKSILAFEKEKGYTPTGGILWSRMVKNPPPDYGIEFDKGLNALVGIGNRPLDKESFNQRYKNYYPKLTETTRTRVNKGK